MNPDYFYYYSPVDSDDRKKWLEILLMENRIWFRSPGSLNDINELKPRFVFEGTDKELFSFANDMHIKRSPVPLSPAFRLIKVREYVRRVKKNPREFEHVLHDLLTRVGVLSLSVSATQQTLWAHYAAGHSGACVEFDATMGLFGAAQVVTYVDSIPTINRIKDSIEQMLQKAMFTKLAAWRDEQEWRVIARWRDEVRIAQHLQQHPVPDDRLAFVNAQNGPGYYAIPFHAARRVLLGLRASPDTEAWLRDVVARRTRPIPIVRVKHRDDGSLDAG